MKLIVNERETRALRAFLQGHPLRITSRVTTVEVSRTVAGHSEAAKAQLHTAFKRVALIELSTETAAAAADVGPAALRTLDAIHVASARSVGGELGAFVTYDTRLAEAATTAGLHVESPA